MEEIDLTIPQQVVDLVPDDDTALKDIEKAVVGYERHINAIIETADGEADAAAQLLDVIEHMEARVETYDEFVPELRAWGQSPAYAIAWRDLHADLVRQVADHEELSDHLDREVNRRLVDDGIRLSDLHDD